MPLASINHYLIRSNDVEASRAFYVQVLGMAQLPRPNFPFPGYWLGVGADAQVHLAPSNVQNASLYFIGSPPDAADNNSGVIDHVAFLANEPQQFVAHLQSLQVPYRPRFLSDSKLFQLFLKDPDGVTIELNFFDVDDDFEWDGEDYSNMPVGN